MFSLYLYKKKKAKLLCLLFISHSSLGKLFKKKNNKNKKGLDLLYQVKSTLEFFQEEDVLSSVSRLAR